MLAYLVSRNGQVFNACIGGYCKFSKNTFFKQNVNFNGCKIYGQGMVTFGDNFHSAENLKIMTSYHNYLGEKIPYDETIITKNVTIEENVWVGIDVIILAGVTVGEGAIIQAGSVVVSDIPKLAIAGGAPAKPFRYRDAEKYYRLKIEKRYH